MSKTLIVTQAERKTLVIYARAVVYQGGGSGGGTPRSLQRAAEAGVLTYTLPSAPVGGVVQVYLNSELVAADCEGAVVTITGYDADFIEATDELSFFWTEA